MVIKNRFGGGGNGKGWRMWVTGRQGESNFMEVSVRAVSKINQSAMEWKMDCTKVKTNIGWISFSKCDVGGFSCGPSMERGVTLSDIKTGLKSLKHSI